MDTHEPHPTKHRARSDSDAAAEAVQVLGARMSYRDYGSGAALAIVGPALAGAPLIDRAMSTLQRNRRCIEIALPGFGSEAPPGRVPFAITVEESAAAIASTLNLLRIEHFDLLGYGCGAPIARTVAAFWPGRVGRLALVTTAGEARHDAREANRTDAVLGDPEAHAAGWREALLRGVQRETARAHARQCHVSTLEIPSLGGALDSAEHALLQFLLQPTDVSEHA